MKTYKLKNGKEVSLPRESDVVLIEEAGKIQIKCKAKKGYTDYWHFFDYSILVSEKGKNNVRDEYNKRTRTLSINGINRPASEGAQVKKAIKETRDVLSKEAQEKLDKDLIALIAKATREAKEANSIASNK